MTAVKRTTIQRLIEDGQAILEKSTFAREKSNLTKEATEAGIAFKVVSQYDSRDHTFVVLELTDEEGNEMPVNKYSINEIMTIIEASERYGINHDTLKNKFKKSIAKEKLDAWIEQGLIRQSGRTWLVTEQFIENNFPVRGGM